MSNISLLDEEHRFTREGFLIKKNLLTIQECDDVVSAAMNLEGASKGSYGPIMQAHKVNPIFLDIMKNSAIVETASSLIDAKLNGLQTEFFYSGPGTNGFSAHQDNFFVEAPKNCFISAWIALTDTCQENGGLFGYPGTHREGMLPVKPLNEEFDAHQDKNARNEETDVPLKYKDKLVSLIVDKGSVVFLDGAFVHGSYKNQSNGFRWVMLCTYLKKSSKYRPGNYAKRQPIKLD